MTVETVRGPVELDALGRALMHEHLFIADQEGLLRAVVDAGYSTFVDPTAFGLGRDVRRVARVNERCPSST